MKITILGNNGPFAGPGSACSGYLISDENVRVLIDCGNGVLANLQRFCKIEELDAIILTHLHSDHMSDMMILKYAVSIKRNRKGMDGAIKTYAPDEPAEEYARLKAPEAFDLEPLHEDRVLTFGKLKFTFCRMKHPVKSLAVSVEDGNNRFVFSADTSWCEEIIRFSKGADLLLLDAGLLTWDKTGENVPHLTSRECGRVAAQAGAKKLLLTHFWPEYDKSEILEEAKAEFPKTMLAEMLQTYVL